MPLLDDARARVDQADIVMMILIEQMRHTGHQATPANVCLNIKGAPIKDVARRLHRLHEELQVLERLPAGYAISAMGAELLTLETEGGWQPSPDEEERRNRQLSGIAPGGFLL